MNDLTKVTARIENEDAFKYGLSTLHAWIRSMEMILHISYNLGFQKWSASTPENKKIKEEKKKYVQTRFRELLGLHIDKPRQGSGNSNDGNTARIFPKLSMFCRNHGYRRRADQEIIYHSANHVIRIFCKRS